MFNSAAVARSLAVHCSGVSARAKKLNTGCPALISRPAAGPKAEQKRAAEERERSGARHTSHETSRFLRGDRIDPRRIDGSERVADLIDGSFLVSASYMARSEPRGKRPRHSPKGVFAWCI